MFPDYQLWHGDCLQEIDKIETGSVDMILCDLPYQSIGMSWDILIPFEPLWKQYKRIIKRNGAIVLFGSQPFTSMLITSNLKMFRYELIWDKIITTNFQLANFQPLKRHENIIIFSLSPAVFVTNGNQMIYNPQMFKTNPNNIRPLKNKPLSQNMMRIRSGQHIRQTDADISYPTSVIELNKNEAECNPAANRLHPTQKPITLLRYLIRTYSNEGDLILDNCAGSGSTLEAAMCENRRSIGIELYPLPNKPIGNDNPDYFGIATRRLENVARELRGEWKPLQDTGGSFEGLPLLESIQC